MDDTQKDAFLHNLYYTEHRAQGRDKLFAYISKTLDNKDISRRYIQDWLAKQTVSQIYRQKKKPTNIRPIITKKPGSIIAIDLIDFSKKPSQYNYRFILNVIDTFSRKIWLTPLKNKTNANVLKAFKKILEEIESKYTVSVLVSDGGGEFTNWESFLSPIKVIKTRPHSPQQNSLVERSNGTIQRILEKILYSEKTKNWVKYIPEIQNIYNTTVNRSLKTTPDLAYELEGQERVDLHEQQIANHAKSFKQIDSSLKVGDQVRILVLTNKKKGSPNYSEEIYKIAKVVKGDKISTNNRYKIDGIANTFSISSLIYVPPGTE